MASKTVVGVKAPATFGLQLTYAAVSFDGVSASAVPVLVELCYCTWATNPPGTNSTTINPVTLYGKPTTPGFTAAKNWTTEPTTLTPLDEMLLTPNAGRIRWRFSPGYMLDTATAEGFAIRCNAPAAVNVRATLNLERF